MLLQHHTISTRSPVMAATTAMTQVAHAGTVGVPPAGQGVTAPTLGIQSFYKSKIQSYVSVARARMKWTLTSHILAPQELLINERTQNLRRLEAQRNTLNTRVRLLREELQLLQEPGSYVGEVVKVMGRKKVLVKVQPEGKYSA